ncbi:MAG: hypothetical protein C0468_03700 [Planctomyces sp.]|nr:hypothetical protein [Planctomyces sp.]
MSALPRTIPHDPPPAARARLGLADRAPTRAELLSLARSRRPFEFLPPGLAALAAAPTDDALRLLAAAHLAMLGLRTAALEHLALLSPRAAAEPGAQAIRSSASALPPDLLPPEQRLETCRTNLAALTSRPNSEARWPALHGLEPGALRGAFDAWRERASAQRWFLTRSGLVAISAQGPAPAGAATSAHNAATSTAPAAEPADMPGWTRLRNDALTLSRVAIPADVPRQAQTVYLDGLTPPGVLRRAMQATPKNPDGSQSRVVAVVADPLALLDALCVEPLGRELTDPRLALFLGPEALGHLAAWLDSRARYIIGGAVVGPEPSAPGSGTVAAVLAEALRKQALRTLAARARVAALYPPSATPAQWAARFARAADAPPQPHAAPAHPAPAAAPSEPTNAAAPADQAQPADLPQPDGPVHEQGGPLRVLIPTCRFSTYIRHASDDLASALRSLGHAAGTLVEPDDHTRLSPLAYLEAVEQARPDMIVLINYTRASMPSLMPDAVPFVCWLQDAMPHLFTPEAGAAQGELDFAVGYCFPELFARFGWPIQRAMASVLAVCPRKFDARAPHPPELAARLACDVAMVTHQSETPEALVQRVTEESAQGPRQAGDAIARVRDAVHGAFAAGHTDWSGEAIDALTARALAPMGPAVATPETIARVAHTLARPLADRILRHQSAAWAASIAKRRGWSFCLHGRGWDRHPILAPYARGELPHGDALRTSYAVAKAHLHAAPGTYLHQRVIECALSGGLPLVRATAACLREVLDHAVYAAALTPGLERLGARDGVYELPLIDSPHCAAVVAQAQRLGLSTAPWVTDGLVRLPEGFVRRCKAHPAWVARQHHEAWLIGDLAQSTFASEAQLETLLEAAVTRPQRRAAMSAAMAARAHRSLTMPSLAGRVVRFVGQSLDTGAAATQAG